MSADADTTATAGRVIVIDVVGLEPEHVDPERTPNLADLLGVDGDSTDDADAETATGTETGTGVTQLRPAFPALTVPAQTTLFEGRGPEAHGDVASGEYDRERDAPAFWERDRGDRNRIWEAASDAGLTTGAMFFQHLIDTTADVAVTPSPIEDENNDLIEMNCWTNPDGFYDDLEERFGHFPLHNYWGPMANEASTEWILDAADVAIDRFDPDLFAFYVPYLDYTGLADGPGEELEAELPVVDEMIGSFLDDRREDDRWDETAVVVLSEYGFSSVDTPVFPNRALREAGLLEIEDDGEGGEQVDIPASDAFAMVDHQITHLYCDDDALAAACDALAPLDGVAEVLGEEGKREYGIDHPNAGDAVLVADADAWFQYYWWFDDANAPYYATDMDIHAKPGFDPVELFVGESGLVSLDASKVGGSHGRTDPETRPAFGVGGPAAPDLNADDLSAADGADDDGVDARAVAPTVADLLGVVDDVEMAFERSSLLDGDP